MTIVEKIILLIVGLPVIKHIAATPIFFYLQKKLSVDLISIFTQGKSDYFAVSQLRNKLVERRRLINYKILNLCRCLCRDGLMSKEHLVAIENTFGMENTIQDFFVGTWGLVPGPQLWGGRAQRYIQDENGILHPIDSSAHTPVLPWVTNEHYFEEHLDYKHDHDLIIRERNEIQWYLSLMTAVGF